ncbi:MAG TPA: hypothetical protein VH682_24535, partial [Gemmataceae bacterium]
DPPAWPVSLEQLDDAALQTFRSKLRMQVWILSQILPANADTAARLPAIRHVLAHALLGHPDYLAGFAARSHPAPG